MRLLCLVALCLLASVANARPYSVDDLLRSESYGQVEIDPGERWIVVDRRGRFDAAPRFDYGVFVDRSVSRLMVLDLDAPTALQPLFEQEPNAGYWSAGFSPSGRRLAVFRLQGERLTLGIIDMATRAVRWLPISPSLAIYNPRPEWIDDGSLIYIGRPDGRLPVALGGGGSQQRSTIGQWSRQAEGSRPSATVLGSGRYNNVGLEHSSDALIRVDLKAGKSATLVQGSIADFAVAPDGRGAAVIVRGNATQPDPSQLVAPGALGRRQRLMLIDLLTGTYQNVCTNCDILPSLLSWSPSSAELLYFARRDGQEWEEGQLYRLRPGSAAVPVRGLDTVVKYDAQGGGYAAYAAWAGSKILVWSRQPSGHPRWQRIGESDLTPLPGADPTSLLGTSGLESYHVLGSALRRVDATGRSVDLLRGAAVRPAREFLDPYTIGVRRIRNPDRRGLRPVTMMQDGRTTIVQMDPATGRQIWSIPLPNSEAHVLATSSRRRALVYYAVGEDRVGLLRLAQVGGPTTTIDTINEHLRDVEPVRQVAIHTETPDGTRLTHWLTLPQAARGPLPLVVLPYAGLVFSDTRPSGGWRLQTSVNPHLLAAAGFAVLEPSIPRNRPEGDFAAGVIDLGPTHPENDKDAMRHMTQIVLSAVDAAGETGLIDASRIALYGHSFGGYSAAAIATCTERFAAVIASAGPYDFASGYGRLAPMMDIEESGIQPLVPFGWFERGQGALGGMPWKMPDTYRGQSPYYAVERLRAPLMLIHGDLDTVPYSGAERMFMALYRLNRDALLVRYGGEGHVLVSPANIRDQWHRIFAFLEEHLKAPEEVRGASGAPKLRSSPGS